MGETKLSFKRYEKKYLLPAEVFPRLLERLTPCIEPDEYPRNTVCSVYYDWEDYRLIRHSLDAPVYKEKLRLRAYDPAESGGEVFVELKKKYKGVVYKRRLAMREKQAEDWLAGGPMPEDSQIARELQWFLRENRLAPKAFIACDRSSWRARENAELRITFDERIRWRERELHLSAGSWGELLLPGGEVLMELKLPGAAPLWLARMLSELKLYPTGFSKYGVCYQDHVLQDYLEGKNCFV